MNTSHATSGLIAPGFSDPVHQAQQVFRCVLDALAQPVRPVQIESLPPSPVSSFSSAMIAIALSLCDQDTAVWIQPETDSPDIRTHLRFHCGTVFADTPSEASFAFIGQPQTMPHFSLFRQGTPSYPEQSTTLVIAASFANNTHKLSAYGPGIANASQDNPRSFHCSGLPDWFWSEWQENRSTFPLGVDALFLDQGPETTRLMGLPRTTFVSFNQNGCEEQDKDTRPCM